MPWALESPNSGSRVIPEYAIGCKRLTGSIQQLLQYANCRNSVSIPKIDVVHNEPPSNLSHGTVTCIDKTNTTSLQCGAIINSCE
jgi:hypothetical protein